MNIYHLKTLDGLIKVPDSQEAYATWIEQNDIIPFLEIEIEDEYVILFASHEFTYIESLLIPKKKISSKELEKLKDWQPIPRSSWGIWSGSKVWIQPALAGEQSSLLQQGEQLYYAREFEGDSDLRYYYELPQKMAHILGIHFILARMAWCKLDHLGDVVEVVKLLESENEHTYYRFLVMRRDALAEYMGLTKTQLLRRFDFTRYKPSSFNGWNAQNLTDMPIHPSIFGKFGIIPGYASYTRGIQIAPFALSQKEVNKRHGFSSFREKRQYASFIALDVKNKRIAELSCDPKKLDSYFTDTGQPFQITPAFFKPEVLIKYKTDHEKYILKDRSILCRGSWSLEKYDINEAGQVHTYLKYLSYLPYEEQLHWRQYNEAPKTGISKRAFATDIQGMWFSEYEPLNSLKSKLDKLNKGRVEWWKLKGTNNFDKVHYPFSTSQKEWADEILGLDQLLVEGLNEKWLRKKAESLGQKPVPQLRFLKLLELCLVGLGFEADHAYELLSPFQILHDLRSKVKGHVEGEEAKKIIKDLKRKHGSFREHYKALVTSLDESLQKITEAMS